MSNCVVLGDKAVQDLLINLNKDEALFFLNQIQESLKSFSLSDERSYQPDPAVINRPDGRRNLFRLFTSPTGVGVKIIVDPSQALANDQSIEDSAEKNRLMALHGIIALCDENGFPTGFINAEEVTSYRTSLSSMILYVRRQKTANVVVFGAGKVALWTIRLILILRGNGVKRITVINRSASRTTDLLAQIKEENDRSWKASVKLEQLESNDEVGLENCLGQADAIFCTTPSKQVLFPARYLLSESRSSSCYVSAIGSWQANMIELDPELLQHVAGQDDSRALVICDDRESCLTHTGEMVQSGLKKEKLAEVGEILDMIDGGASEHGDKTKRCIEDGFVIYKSVGVSLTDLAAGQAILKMAKRKDQGTSIPDF